ncbi:4-alpha-glucanotransferase [Actomonas aquatica]|uniref:4-alpha-glucanotransferase n=1 Tax=Actomonas aquatica TaxID=2866162 RepID=A0ABZ1CB78_9BACT|nr:4-alpha-glucanotransferase [Opitutus sp. WL0086]WRQ88900.1 4-alpha-glucanotransferase [Opitutus sp. WL0086]
MNASRPTWLRCRSSGVLAPLSALPGAFGIGNLGTGARAFVDFLADTGFQHWQICPAGPTGFGDSPYQSFSSFAGNPYFIDLGELEAEGLLTADELAPLRALPAHAVDYGTLYERFGTLLARAHERFLARGEDAPWGGASALAEFEATHSEWLPSYAAFMALKNHFGGHAWTLWLTTWRDWQPGIEARLPAPAAEDAAHQRFCQFLFFRQWEALRTYAAARGVAIIGDVPIFVAMDSADTWRWREVFRLDERGRPEAIAGVPPDYFSDRGQCWGNPLYNWAQQAETGYAWWIERLRAAFAMCDIVRLDHFRGFHTFWEIPAGAPDARGGVWRDGPGLPFFEAIAAALPEVRLIAEDLGYINAGVAELRRAVGLPGMKILQFGYGHDDNNVNLPHFYPAETVVYTGTHDNDTTRGWLEHLDAEAREPVAEYFGIGESNTAWPLLRAAFASVARLAIVPIQDLLDLPSSARMNRPGTMEDNWRWRFQKGQLDQLVRKHGETLRHWHRLFDRDGDPRQRDYSAPPGELTALPSSESAVVISSTTPSLS